MTVENGMQVFLSSQPWLDGVDPLFYDFSALPPNYAKLSPRVRTHLKGQCKKALMEEQKGRDTVLIGVTENVEIKERHKTVTLTPDQVYRVSYGQYAALRLDSVRSPKVCLLEPQYPHLRFEVRGALRQMFPEQRQDGTGESA